MATTEQLVRINAPQLATATDRLLYASTPRQRACASRVITARPQQVRAAAARFRSWLLVAIIVVLASVAAALVGHTRADVIVDGARVV